MNLLLRPNRRVAPMLLAALAVTAAGWLPGFAPALAQGSTSASDQPEPPFVGEVSVDRVEVRSGAGESYYPVAVLNAGDRVRVVEDFYGWYRIEAPEGLHAFVSRKDLDRRGDGSVGVANAEATRVTIKGIDRGWNESFRTIRTLAPGDRVEIVAAAGDEAYEILAPAGSLVFLPPGSVEPLAQLTAGSGGRTQPTAPAPAPGPAASGEMVPLGEAVAGDATTPAPEAAPAVEPIPPAPAVEAPDTLPPLDLSDGGEETAASSPEVQPLPPATPEVAPSAGVAAVEEAQLPRFALPLEEQPLGEMQAAYEDLLTDEALRPFEQRLVNSRLSAIQRNRQLSAAIAQIQQRRDGLVDVEPTRIEPEPDAPYAAVGVLRTSTVFAGEEAGVAMPKMFRVVDPATGRTTAYLRPARGIDPVPLIGQLVGVRGAREIDSTLNTPLVTAQSVEALDASASAE